MNKKRHSRAMRFSFHDRKKERIYFVLGNWWRRLFQTEFSRLKEALRGWRRCFARRRPGTEADSAENGQPSALLRMLGKRAAERSPSVSPAKADAPGRSEEEPAKVPFELGELDEDMGQGGAPPPSAKLRNWSRVGSDISRWEDRAHEDSIKSQIIQGRSKRLQLRVHIWAAAAQCDQGRAHKAG